MNLRHSLHTDSIKHIDLSFYVEVRKGTSVRLAIEKMQVSHRKCALIVEHGKLVGIFTAHDIPRRVTSHPEVYDQPIESIMTPDPMTLDSELKIIEAIQIMNDKPYRYMPVVTKNKDVLGTLTHYAILKFMTDHFPQDIYNLPPDPDQIATSKAGA